EITNIANVRQGNVNNEEHIGAIVGDVSGSFAAPSDMIVNGMFAEENRVVLNNILHTVESVFSVSGANYTPILELRVFYASQSGFQFNNNAWQMANAIKLYLTGGINLHDRSSVKDPSLWLKSREQDIRPTMVDSDD